MVFGEVVRVGDKLEGEFGDGRVGIREKIRLGCKWGVMDMGGGLGEYLGVEGVVE